MTNYQLSNSKNGFTLIELVVVLGLFMLIMGSTVSIFISIVQHQKRILSQQEMLSQASFVEDYFSRSIRSAIADVYGTCLTDTGVTFRGYLYLLTRIDAKSGFYQGIKFISKEGVCQEFFLDADGILKEIKNDQKPQDLLSKKFQVQYFRFLLQADKRIRAVSGNTDTVPRVSLAGNIRDSSYENGPQILMQTTISHRNK